MKSLSMFAAIAASTLSSVGLAQSWFGEYNPRLGTLPTAQGWTLMEDGIQPPPAIVNGELRQGPTTFTSGQHWVRSDVNTDFNTTTGVAMELRLKVISSSYDPALAGSYWRAGYSIWMSDGQRRVIQLGITSNGVRIANDGEALNTTSSPLINIDTTSTFRTYRLTADRGGVRLFVDGLQVATLPLGVPDPVETPTNEWRFGDSTNWASSETVLQGLRWGIVPSPAGTCYANCDGSTGAPFLSPADFTCFLAKYRAGCP